MFFPYLGTLAALLTVGAFALQPTPEGGADQEKKKSEAKGAPVQTVRPEDHKDAVAAAKEEHPDGKEEGEDEDGAEKDDPDGRREWFGKWFGPVTAEHLDLVTHIGEQEIAKWGHLIPGTRNYRKPEMLPNGGIPPNVWRNIGPFDGSSIQSSGLISNDNIVDSGRPTTIVPHPTNSSILYVGFAGGGLWRATNATLTNSENWNWQPMTDGLPGGGNLSVGAAALDPDDPNKVYVSLGDMMSGSAPMGTAHGRGFYISSDGGATWVKGAAPGRCTRTKTVLALGGSRVLVAGNMGLFRSTDGGMNFTRITNGPLADGAGETYTGAPYRPNEFASAWDILKLNDGTLVLSYQFCDGNGTYDGSRPSSGYGTFGGGGIAYSTDQGVTWTKATYPARGPATNVHGYGRIAICASGNTLYGLFQDGSIPDSGNFPKSGGSGQLLKSTDGGRTWEIITGTGLFSLSSDGGQTGYNHLIAVDPTNPDLVFAGANLALYRSTNGGLNFSRFAHWTSSGGQYIHADLHVGVWTPTTQTGNAKALYIATDGGLSIVRNPGIATIPTSTTPDPTVIDHRRNRGLATHLIYNIGCTNATEPATGGIQPVRDRLLAGFQDLGTLVRLNNTDRPGLFRWTGVGGDGFGCLIHPYNGQLMLASLYDCEIRRSTNGGSSWSSAVSGISTSEDTPFYTRLYLGMADPTGNSVYTFTDPTVYYNSNFGSGSWTALTKTTASGWPSGVTEIRNMNVSPLRQGLVGVLADVNDASVPVAQRRGTIILSRNNGQTWTATRSAFPNNRGYLSSIGFDTMNENIMYVASCYPSTWNTAGQAMGETYNHIWKSIDGGLTFTAVDGTAANPNGFPFGVMVHCVKVDPLDNQVVYAGTEIGLYYTQNGGQTWERYGTGLPMVNIYDIYIAPNGSFMRVGTHGRGIWEMQGAESAPVISVHPSPVTVTAGGQATFSVVAVGNPDPTIQWQSQTGGGSWSNVAGATSATYTFTAALADNGKLYRAVATNSVGSSTSNSAALTVASSTAPTITTHPSPATVTDGGQASFTVAATGTAPITYQWQSQTGGGSWGNVAGATSATYTFTAAMSDNGKLFRAVATNSAGSATSNSAALTVTSSPIAPAISSHPVATTVTVGGQASFTVAATGSPAPTYQWQSQTGGGSWGNVAGATSATYTFTAAMSDNGKLFRAVATNSVGSATSNSAALTVTSSPIAPAISSHPVATTVTVGGQASFTVAATGTAPITYQWQSQTGGGSWGNVAGATSATYTFTAAMSDNGKLFRAVATNSVGSATSNSAALTVTPNYDIDDAPGFDVFDVLKFLSLYGSTSTSDIVLADYNGDGRIDDADLRLMLDALGRL